MKELTKKYAAQFKPAATVKEIAEYIILEESQLKDSQKAELVRNIKEAHGLECDCSTACISWYKNKMKNKSEESQARVDFQKFILSAPKQVRDKILIELANKHVDKLIKIAKPEALILPTENKTPATV
jgi:hypothetical protein